MSSQNATFHALLRPCVLQILRATGYYATRTAVLDTMTDLAGRYMYLLCQKMAMHAAHNATENDPSIVDLRMALQDVGALLPERPLEEQEYLNEEDMRGVEAFIEWFQGPGHTAIREIAVVDGDAEATDYLNGTLASEMLLFLPFPGMSLLVQSRTGAANIFFDSSENETQQDGRRLQVSFHYSWQGQ
jgi:transcription initiation factor TFIID subunit 3